MNYELPDFDTLLERHKNDVKALDQIKKEATEAFINNVPKESQRRLRGLQFQIDMELRRSKSPIEGCINISTMMHESLAELRSQLNQIFDTDYNKLGESNHTSTSQRAEQKMERKSADILPFTTYS